MNCSFTEGGSRGGAESTFLSVLKVDPVRPIGIKIGTSTHLDTRNKPANAFLKFHKIDLSRRSQRSNLDQNLGLSDCMVRKVDPVPPICTKINTGTRLDTRNKPVEAFLEFCKMDLSRRGQSTDFRTLRFVNSDPVSPICTKIGTGTYLCTRTTHAKAFLKKILYDCGSYGQGVLTKLPWRPLHYESL